MLIQSYLWLLESATTGNGRQGLATISKNEQGLARTNKEQQG
jgi:hypothetical protein